MLTRRGKACLICTQPKPGRWIPTWASQASFMTIGQAASADLKRQGLAELHPAKAPADEPQSNRPQALTWRGKAWLSCTLPKPWRKEGAGPKGRPVWDCTPPRLCAPATIIACKTRQEIISLHITDFISAGLAETIRGLFHRLDFSPAHQEGLCTSISTKRHAWHTHQGIQAISCSRLKGIFRSRPAGGGSCATEQQQRLQV